MQTTFTPGDRIVNIDGMRGDVLKVAKNGNLYVEFWGRGFATGKLVRMWQPASLWRKV